MVYVDDYNARYRGMLMCHMIADTDEELHAMATLIGVEHRHWQKPPHDSHYDICLAKKALAIKAGAIAITDRQAASMNSRRRFTGSLGAPEDSIAWRLGDGYKAAVAARRVTVCLHAPA